MVTGGPSVAAVAAAGPGAAPATATATAAAGAPAAPDSPLSLPPPTAASAAAPGVVRRSGENRRSNKPIMEKRRRARINHCLNELKSLILDAMKKDPARHSKLEKADILEMTVKHLETLQRQQSAMSAAADPSVLDKFRAGFSECAGEVGRFPGLEAAVRRRLLQHLASCLGAGSGTAEKTPSPTPTTPPAATPTVQVHILQPGAATATHSGGIFLATANGGHSLQLVPTRLPNGDIALVLPSTGVGLRQTPAATPTPTRSSPSSSPAPSTSSSTSSSSSSSSSSSPLPLLSPVPARAASPVPFDRLSPQVRDVATSPAGLRAVTSPAPFQQRPRPRPYSPPPAHKPLSLVMRKGDAEGRNHPHAVGCLEGEKPWRPW